MREIPIGKRQSQSACTIISVLAIKAISELPNDNLADDELKRVLNAATVDGERVFKQMQEAKEDVGAGISAAVFLRGRHNPNGIDDKSIRIDNLVLAQVNGRTDSTEELIRQIRLQHGELVNDFQFAINGQREKCLMEFFVMIGDTIEDLLKQGVEVSFLNGDTKEGKPPELSIVQHHARIEQTTETPNKEKIIKKLQQLKNSGMCVTINGHTVSITEKNGQFYYFDSNGGMLRIGKDINAMAEHLSESWTSRQIKDVSLVYCQYKPMLVAAPAQFQSPVLAPRSAAAAPKEKLTKTEILQIHFPAISKLDLQQTGLVPLRQLIGAVCSIVIEGYHEVSAKAYKMSVDAVQSIARSDDFSDAVKKEIQCMIKVCEGVSILDALKAPYNQQQLFAQQPQAAQDPIKTALVTDIRNQIELYAKEKTDTKATAKRNVLTAALNLLETNDHDLDAISTAQLNYVAVKTDPKNKSYSSGTFSHGTRDLIERVDGLLAGTAKKLER